MPSFADAHVQPRTWRQAARRMLAASAPHRYLLVSGPRAGRSAYLTFDDGPDPEHTPALLDALDRFDIRATFFVVGRQAEAHPELVRRIVDAGHALGNHTYSHADADQLAPRRFAEEVRKTGEVLREITGQRVTLFRPPHGRVGASSLWRWWAMGQTVALWNVDPKDYLHASSGPVEDFFSRRPLEVGDIVLLHDNRPHAAAITPQLAAQARRRRITLRALGSSSRALAAAPGAGR